MNAGIINYAVYENGSEYLGTASINLPDMTNQTLTVSGAGIPGNVNIPIPGHREAMTLTINFHDVTEAAYKLAEHRVHIIDLRVAHESYSASKGSLGVEGYTHVLEIIPVKLGGGSIAPASPQGVSGEYSCISRKDYLNGKLMLDYEPLKFRDVDPSGRDNLAEVRNILGK